MNGKQGRKMYKCCRPMFLRFQFAKYNCCRTHSIQQLNVLYFISSRMHSFLFCARYITFLMCSYQSTLKQLFQEFSNGDESNSQLAAVTMRIMQALQTNLDGKSKQYRDTSLTHLFLMNNIHYMVRSVRRFVIIYLYNQLRWCALVAVLV